MPNGIDQKYSENVYNALKSNLVTFNYEIFSKWISNGAQMSETVKKLLKLAKKQGFIAN